MEKSFKKFNIVFKIICVLTLFVLAFSTAFLALNSNDKNAIIAEETIYTFNAANEFNNGKGVWAYKYAKYKVIGGDGTEGNRDGDINDVNGVDKSRVKEIDFIEYDVLDCTYNSGNNWFGASKPYTFIGGKNENASEGKKDKLQFLIDSSNGKNYGDFPVLQFTAPHSGIVDIMVLSVLGYGNAGESGRYHFQLYNYEKALIYSNKDLVHSESNYGTTSYLKNYYVQKDEKLYLLVDFNLYGSDKKGDTSASMAYVNLIVDYKTDNSLNSTLEQVKGLGINEITIENARLVKDAYNYIQRVDRAKNALSDIEKVDITNKYNKAQDVLGAIVGSVNSAESFDKDNDLNGFSYCYGDVDNPATFKPMENSKTEKDKDYRQGGLYGFTLIGKTLMLIDPDDNKVGFLDVPVRCYTAPKNGKIILDLTFGMNLLQHLHTFDLVVCVNEQKIQEYDIGYLTKTQILLFDVTAGDKIFVYIKKSDEVGDSGKSNYTSADVELTVGYKESVGIGYNLDGGTNNQANPSVITPGYTYQTLKRPTKEGYGFKGWYLDSNYETKVVAITPDMGQNTILYAKWQQAQNLVSISLDGDIRANIYLDADAYTEDENAYVKLIYNHNKTSYSTIREADIIRIANAIKDGKHYKFSVGCAAGQIADLIDLELYDSTDELLYSLSNYSVKTYCEMMIDDNTQTDELKNLCKAVLNYGGYAQQYFGYNTSNVANSGKGFANDVDSVTANDINGEKDIQGNATGMIVGSKISFTCLEKSSVSFYYALANDKTISDYEISISSGFSYRLGSNNVGTYIEIYNIASVDLDKAFTLTITEKTSKTTITITYSALTFAKEKIEQNSNQGLVKLFKALYTYNNTAEIYFNKVD